MAEKGTEYNEDIVVNVSDHHEESSEIHYGIEEHSDVDICVTSQNEQHSEREYGKGENEDTANVHVSGNDRNEEYQETKYGEDAALDAVSGATLGSLCTYVQTFGTPHQREKVNEIRGMIVRYKEHEEQAHRNRKIGESDTSIPVIDWKKYRQQLYEISGDWLWLHATNYWRTKVAPQMDIPKDLLETSLLVDKLISKIDDDTHGKSNECTLQNEDNYNQENIELDKFARPSMKKSIYLQHHELDHDRYSVYFENDDDKLCNKIE